MKSLALLPLLLILTEASRRECPNIRQPNCVKGCPQIEAFKSDIRSGGLTDYSKHALQEMVDDRQCGEKADETFCCKETQERLMPLLNVTECKFNFTGMFIKKYIPSIFPP